MTKGNHATLVVVTFCNSHSLIVSNLRLIQRKGEGGGVIVKLTVGRFCTVNLCPSSIFVFIAAVFCNLLTAYKQLNFAGSQSWCCQQQSCTDANLVQLGTLRRADRTIPIDFFLGAEGFTGTFFRLCVGRSLWVPAVLCIANLANIGARRSLCGGNIAVGFIVGVIAGFRVGQPAATLIVFMGTGNFRRSLGVAAAFVMLGVVFTQSACACDNAAVLYACFGKRHCRQQRHDHAQADKRRK